jgi:hypothetical protein
MHDHAYKKHHGELGFAFFAPHAPARLENYRKDEGVNSQHEHWVEEGPSQPNDRAFVTTHHFALSHLQNKLLVAPETSTQ